MKQVVLILTLVSLGGCGGTEPLPGELSAKEAGELLASQIGRWECTGQYRPADGPAQDTRLLSEVRWKEEGNSIQFSESMTEPVEVKSVGGREYDAARGVFILTHKEGDGPMKRAVERYDPVTRTLRSEGILQEDLSVETAFQQIDEDTWKWTMKIFKGDRLDFTSEQVSRRIR